MKLFYIIVSLFVTIFLISIVPDIAHGQDINVPEFIAMNAQAYHLDPQMALFVSWGESEWNPNVSDGDGHIMCNIKTSINFGKYTHSRGVWQISDCAHPEVTDAQAHDLKWSTQWAMKTMVNDGGCFQWSTCNMKK